MKPCLRISKKVRDRVHRLWRDRPDLCFVEVAALLGYSEPELVRLTRRWVRVTTREYRARSPIAAFIFPLEAAPLSSRWRLRGHLTVLETEGDSEYAEYPCANEADRAFIEHAPSDITALIDEVRALRERAAAAENEADRLRARLREVAQVLIADVGADGPMDAEDAARKAVERMVNLRVLADEKAAEAGLYARRMEQAQQSRNDERAAVVAGLRADAKRMYEAGQDRPAWFILERMAEAIERGDHRNCKKEETP